MMLNNNLFIYGSIHHGDNHFGDVSIERQCAFIIHESFSAAVLIVVVLGVTVERNTVDQILIEGDNTYVKAFEQQSIPDTETLDLSLTYLPNRTVWPSTRPNQSPIESNNATKSIAHCH